MLSMQPLQSGLPKSKVGRKEMKGCITSEKRAKNVAEGLQLGGGKRRDESIKTYAVIGGNEGRDRLDQKKIGGTNSKNRGGACGEEGWCREEWHQKRLAL